jgi:hypothetical protein
MGREARCRVRAAGREVETKVLLETDELIVRGDLRLRLPFATLTRVEARCGTLLLDGPDGPVEIDVGEKEAERWAARIRNPPTLRQRLGLADDATVALLGAPDGELREALGQAASADPDEADAVFASIEDRGGLDQVPALADGLRRDASLWIVYPKGRKEVREADVLAAGRAAGLKDTRVARVSATHTGLRFVVPLADR